MKQTRKGTAQDIHERHPSRMLIKASKVVEPPCRSGNGAGKSLSHAQNYMNILNVGQTSSISRFSFLAT